MDIKKLTPEEIDKFTPAQTKEFLDSYFTKKSIQPLTRFHKIRTNIITKLSFLYQKYLKSYLLILKSYVLIILQVLKFPFYLYYLYLKLLFSILISILRILQKVIKTISKTSITWLKNIKIFLNQLDVK